MQSSSVAGFSKLTVEEKIKIIKEFSDLNKADLELIRKYQELPDFLELENNIGTFKIATNFLVNGKDYFVPMEIEEPSVVAAASRGAKLIRAGGGFAGKYLESKMIGELQLLNIKNFEETKKNIVIKKSEILKIANETSKHIVELGGGAKDLEIREVNTERGKNLVLFLIVDTLDAMGANIVNTMLESITPFLVELTKGKPSLRIISNFADKRIVSVKCKIPIEKLALGNSSGEEVAEGILNACALAKVDIYRAVTHNKGVMNGIDAVSLATGNDWRAIEAGVHSYAGKKGYQPVTGWWKEKEFLEGKIEIPMAIATVGGATNSKKAALALKILRVENARELGILTASVGLANNLSALSALVSEGIQAGHMKLHKEFVELRKKYKV